MWQRGQFKGQRQNPFPRRRPRAQPPAQGARCKNRRRERPVFAITLHNCRRQLIGLDPSGVLCQPVFGPFDDGAIFCVRAGHGAERRPAQRRGAEVAETERSVTPAAVGIDVAREPIEALGNAEHGARSAE